MLYFTLAGSVAKYRAHLSLDRIGFAGAGMDPFAARTLRVDTLLSETAAERTLRQLAVASGLFAPGIPVNLRYIDDGRRSAYLQFSHACAARRFEALSAPAARDPCLSINDKDT